IAKLFKQEGISGRVTFHCHPRANLMDDETCRLLKELGVTTINFGFESGSERMLHYLKGGSVTVEDNKRAVILGKKYGFSVVGSLIFGSPGERIDDMRKTLVFIDFFDKNRGDNLWHFVMTPFPGTPIWEIAKERGKVSDDMDWDLLRHQNIDKPLLLDPGVDLEEFKRIFNDVEERIYRLRASRKGWIMRKILKDPLRLVKRVKQDPTKAVKTLLYLLRRPKRAG
ncbi:MAG: radical SAM protein, partial [Candidatus Hydrothermarchaeota archaeon]|nr:radical SAM protein [Candidatus Hydrothermarchaeota archaeon]